METPDSLPRAVGYVRVSTDEQATTGHGLDAQRTQIALACEQRGWHLVDVVADEGVSGSTTTRPGLDRVLSLLDGEQADVLVTAKLDRLSRSAAHFHNLTEHAKRKGWGVVCLDIGVDTTTPAGRMMLGMVAVFAEYERALISQRVKEGLEAARAKGVRLGRPRAVPDDVRAYVASLRASGLSWRAVARQLTSDGIPTGHGGQWHHHTVRQLVA